MQAPLALYRRYRPETFAEVIGQEHVTEPLRAALASNRVNHAYLFSGPRGCGKTTSARILARSLNCAKAPIADPCGECDSCVELARGGPGSIDVIEIDAASHNGVDDARDLREKAWFAPVRDHYKVYIIDEAHMVTPQAFNALLKLVEEPPEHLRFIFATTEPEKVIPTIRSRTHHYPFRLIPPRLLSSYLSELCEKEGVPVEAAALPLVVRAGAGSARDTLSVLDQLMGGAGAGGVTYELAAGLLGYTPDTLLDEVVDAFAAGDGATVFGVVDKVIETGQDPRRFAEDLLRRLRDLVIVAAVPGATASGLIDVSEDQGERLVAQAARFGAADLSRAADILATGLTEMRGATAPRLLLELLCARVLLPGSDDTTQGVAARLDRIERRMTITGTPAAPTPAPAPAARVEPARPEPARVGPAHPSGGEQGTVPVREAVPEPPAPAPAEVAPPAGGEPGPVPVAGTVPEPPPPAPTPTAAPQAAAPAPAAKATAETPTATGALSLIDVRRLWPDVVEATKLRRRMAWIHLSQNCQVLGIEGNTLTLAFANAGARDSFESSGCAEVVHQAAIEIVGADWRIETVVDPSAQPEGTPQVTRSAVESPTAPSAPAPAPGPAEPPSWASDEPEAAAPAAPAPPASPPAPTAASAAREVAAREAARTPAGVSSSDPDADADPDDRDADDNHLGSEELLTRELGAQMIEEIANP